LAILSVLLGVYPEWIYSKIHYSVLTLII
jgi:hypothetical protein